MTIITFKCELCGKIFYKNVSYVNRCYKKGHKIRYCSPSCHIKAMNLATKANIINTFCENCNKKITKTNQEYNSQKHHFCSRSCSATFTNKLAPKRKKKPFYTCKKCLKSFNRIDSKPMRKLCPDCSNKKINRFKNYTFAEYKKFIKSSNKNPHCRINDRIRYLNRTWNKNLLTHTCQYCGYNKHAELSHKKSISSFSDDALLSEINSPSNNIVLCPNHHWEYDNNILSYEDIEHKTTPDKI